MNDDNKGCINSNPTTVGYKDVNDKLKNENEEVRKINEVLRREIEDLKRAVINLAIKLH